MSIGQSPASAVNRQHFPFYGSTLTRGAWSRCVGRDRDLEDGGDWDEAIRGGVSGDEVIGAEGGRRRVTAL